MNSPLFPYPSDCGIWEEAKTINYKDLKFQDLWENQFS